MKREKRPPHADLVDAAKLDYNTILSRGQIPPLSFLEKEAEEFLRAEPDSEVDKMMRDVVKRMRELTPSIDGRRSSDMVEVTKTYGLDIISAAHPLNQQQQQQQTQKQDQRRGLFNRRDE